MTQPSMILLTKGCNDVNFTKNDWFWMKRNISPLFKVMILAVVSNLWCYIQTSYLREKSYFFFYLEFSLVIIVLHTVYLIAQGVMNVNSSCWNWQVLFWRLKYIHMGALLQTAFKVRLVYWNSNWSSLLIVQFSLQLK